MFLRIIILLVVVLLLMWLLKRLFSTKPEADAHTATGSENMRQCRYCGLHVPESDIVMVADEPYCSQEHADLDRD